ncbi:autotransporter domain-containing protein [Ancylobacter sp. WKF20]|uniref:autotransporter outer membrane beta-barrel domain-containing protein n=1 Tax=Ancylobacter sp. WKF20 TaxID=3039801 RepID=UPI0024345171|nr:autotransporter domain-containing protein [Ancylobacter sp. WKF20]WGD30440.1 autotransporter domain-containing protein [Ancylobacter sp. WKF20]
MSFGAVTRGAVQVNSVSQGGFTTLNDYASFKDQTFTLPASTTLTGQLSWFGAIIPGNQIAEDASHNGASPLVYSFVLPSLVDGVAGFTTYEVDKIGVLKITTTDNSVKFSTTLYGTTADGEQITSTISGVLAAPSAESLGIVSTSFAVRFSDVLITGKETSLVILSEQPIAQGFTFDYAVNGSATAGEGALVVPAVLYDADPTAPGSVIITNSADPGEGNGTILFGLDQLYTGGTTINAGATLQLGNGGTSGSVLGDITDNGTLAFNRSDEVTYAGVISGTGALVQAGTGTLILTGASTFTGGASVTAGTLQIGDGGTSGSLATDIAVASGATLAFNRADEASFGYAISGTGALVKAGAGELELTGDNSGFTGTTTVSEGLLSVNGTLGGSVTVAEGGTLGGSGTTGAVTVLAGGTLAPGNSIGTLTINGDVTFEPGSTYQIELDNAGNSDGISTTGRITVNGATLNLVTLDPLVSYASGVTYTILEAAGGVTGSFSQVTSSSIFLNVEEDSTAVALSVVVSIPQETFTSVAVTPNQIATSAALGTLPQTGASLALYNSVLFLTSASEAQWAYDQLSGEVHASTQSLFMEQSSLIRGALNDRLRAAQGGVGASAGTVVNVVETSSGALAYAAPSPVKVAADLSIPVKAAPAVAPVERFALWSTAFGNWGDMDGNSNAAGVSDSTGGFLIGADTLVGDGWRLGVAGGYSYTDFSISGRNSSGSSDNWHIGLYGGNEWGPLALRTGLAYTWQDISTNRSVAFTGYTDSLSADYDAGTVQAFGELGYRIDAAGIAFEPFANLSYVSLHQDGYREEGGAAALTGDSQTMDTTFTTLGVRLAKEIAFGSTAATLRGALGWRHAFGDIDPTVTQAFAGSDAFTVTGAPIAEDAAVVEAGLDVLISATATLGIAYTGQYGDGVSENGFNARLSVRF